MRHMQAGPAGSFLSVRCKQRRSKRCARVLKLLFFGKVGHDHEHPVFELKTVFDGQENESGHAAKLACEKSRFKGLSEMR